MTGEAAPADCVVAIGEGAGNALRLTPATTGTDGFFVGLLDRS